MLIFAKIFALILIISGTFLLLSSEEKIRNALSKKANQRLQYYIFLFILFLTGSMLSIFWKYLDIKIFIAITAISIFILFKGFFLIKKESKQLIFKWLSKQHIFYFRAFTIMQILFGLWIFLTFK